MLPNAAPRPLKLTGMQRIAPMPMWTMKSTAARSPASIWGGIQRRSPAPRSYATRHHISRTSTKRPTRYGQTSVTADPCLATQRVSLLTAALPKGIMAPFGIGVASNDRPRHLAEPSLDAVILYRLGLAGCTQACHRPAPRRHTTYLYHRSCHLFSWLVAGRPHVKLPATDAYVLSSGQLDRCLDQPISKTLPLCSRERPPRFFFRHRQYRLFWLAHCHADAVTGRCHTLSFLCARDNAL